MFITGLLPWKGTLKKTEEDPKDHLKGDFTMNVYLHSGTVVNEGT